MSRAIAFAMVAGIVLLLHVADAWPFNPPFTLPATGTIKYMLVITTKPLPKAPKHPVVYNARPVQWRFKGGPGTLMVASYSDAPAPIGPYNELVYIPGKYAPCYEQDEIYDSVLRCWVDNKASMEVGRYMGGMPKYMANFRWHLDPVTNFPVNVTVRALNKTILRIVGLKPYSSAADTAGSDRAAESAAKAQIEITRTNLQWPIFPPRSPGTPRPAHIQPLVGRQSFDTGTGAIQLLQADRVFMDALTFTGYEDKEMHVVYDRDVAILSPPENSTGTVMPTVNLTCR